MPAFLVDTQKKAAAAWIARSLFRRPMPEGYATREDAIKAICGKLTRFRRMSGIYAGLLVADYNKKMHNVENIGTCGH